MEDVLAKIRPHTSSSLPHQKTPAQLLKALETTLNEQNSDATPTAYFAAILTTLDGSIQKKELLLEEGAILPAELYLLALVAPFVSAPIIRTNLDTVLSLTAPLFPALNQHPPALRSQLSLYDSVFESLDRSQLDVPGVRQSFATILQLCLDPRPKVRKKAADIVKNLLSSPPIPLMRHPYSERVAEWIKSTLTDANALSFGKEKSAKHSSGADVAMHVLVCLRPIVSFLPPESLPVIANLLLALPRLGNTYLSQSCYSMLSDIFTASVEDNSTNIGEKLPDVVKAVLTSPPSKSDFLLCASWVHVLGAALVTLNSVNLDASSSEVGRVWKAVWNFLDSTDANTRKATAESLSTISGCFTPKLISAAIDDRNNSSVIRKIVAQIMKALDSLPYARAIPELLSIISSMIKNLQSKGSESGPTAAEILLLPVIVHIADLRIMKGFEYREAADGTLSMAMRVLGPAVLLEALPLNLELGDRRPGVEPRAFLLPLLAQPHASPLPHFISYFVPLSEKMFDLQQKAEIERRQSEAKVWSLLIGQIWAGLPGYCHESPDLKDSLSPAFSQLLSQLLYGQLDLRPSILKALKSLVESNSSILRASTEPDFLRSRIGLQEAQENFEFLRTQVESWLAVLFNVYGSVARDSRAMVGDVINSWMSIASEKESRSAFQNVFELFKTNLPKAQSNSNHNGDQGNAAATAQDILILLLPNLPEPDLKVLFEFSLTSDVLTCKDNGVQKRGYKILAKIIESSEVDVDVDATLRKLDELVDGLSVAAKKDRLNLLAALIFLLHPNSLHMIPSLLPEAALGTKEPSEKARTAAFDLIIAMGKRMNEGGVVKRGLVDGMDEDGAEDAPANIEEFMTMVAGGLAGATPHMISATVTAISRLVFEFKNEISSKMHNDILSTMVVFLSSANREIVKSVLGFIKLVIHTLPLGILRPHLKELVPGLLNWSHDHKNHFKLKVRHIFERMLRRFSWEELYGYASEEEASKVLVNIKKRKERAKRKKASRAEEDNDELRTRKPVASDAFEDVLYGSESELEDSEGESTCDPISRKKNVGDGARLRLDDEEPMDLLQGATGKITNQPNRRRRSGQDASEFKTDEETGKIIIDGDESDVDDAGSQVNGDVAGSAYRETLTAVDGFTRGPNGRIKFNKDTKRRRREQDAMDVDDFDEMSPGKSKKMKKDELKFGHEFKAKKAAGDVKKSGMEPYAYMPISQAAKAGRRGHIGITGKR